MNVPLTPGSRWQYVGPGDGRGVHHLVTFVSKEEVTTWSAPSAKDDEGGESFLGPIDVFLKFFRPISPISPATTTTH